MSEEIKKSNCGTNNFYSISKVQNKFIRFIIAILNRILDDSSIVKILEESKTINKILIGLSALTLYAFYNLGYAFLYGYYFGGELNNRIPLIDMFINPVPINFKSIVSVGIVLLIYIIMTFFPLGKIILATDIKSIIGYLFMFIVGTIIYIVDCGWIFIGNFDNKVFLNMIYFAGVLILVPLSIFFVLIFLKYSIKYTYKFYSCLLYNVIFTVIEIKGIKAIYPVESIYLEIFIFYNMYFGTVFVTKISVLIWRRINKYLSEKNSKFIIKVLSIFPVDIMLCQIVKQKIGISYASTKYLLMLCMSILLSIVLIISIPMIIQKFKSRKPEVIKDKPKNDEKDIKFNISISAIIFLMIIAIVVPIIPNIIAESGKMTRYTINGLSKDKIIYEKADDKKEFKYIFGNIVAQKDNTYFVSKLPERRLMTIKNTNVISMPCEAFKISSNLDKFYKIESNLSDKYNSLSLNEQLKIINIPQQEIIKNGSLNFSKDIFLQTNSEINKDNYDFGISINIKYDVNKDEEIENFIVRFGHRFPYNINNLDDKNLEEQMEKLLSDYKSAISEYYKLPSLDIDNNRYYYLNGGIEFTEELNDKFNGRYEEIYTFKGSLD